MKQTIRLNERELHQLISESVKRVINEGLDELDWKTYDWAEQKAVDKWLNDKENQDTSKYCAMFNKFGKARNDAFNKKYGYKDDNFEYELTNGRSASDPVRHIYNYEKMRSYPLPYGIHKKFLKYEPYRNDGLQELEAELSHSNNLRDAVNKGDKELTDYYNGNYEYVKGQGWKLKDKNESIIRESVRRAIRRNLR